MQTDFFNIFKTERFNKIFNIFLLVIFIAITVLTMINHELWRDEAQAWLVVRDMGMFGIINHVKTEGHPLLWYAILFPFAKLHLPVFSMQIVSCLLSLCVAVLLLFYSPFNKVTKTAVLFSSGFVYWYSVIARSYSLIPPLLCLCAMIYPKRLEKPYVYAFLLILLSNTHVLMFGFCAMLALFFGFELYSKWNSENKNQKRIAFPLFILFINFCLLVTYLAIGKSENLLVQNYEALTQATISIYSTIVSIFVNIYMKIPFILLIFLIFIFMFFFIKFYKNDKKIFWIAFIGIIFQIVTYRFIWSTSPEKAFLLLLILIFGFWVIYSENKIFDKQRKMLEIMIIFIFLLSWPVSFISITNDIKYDYSGSKSTAKYIKKQIPENAILISNYNVTTAAISAYLPSYKFYFPQEKSFYTFSKWNSGILSPYIDYSDFSTLPRYFRNKKLYFIFSYITSPDELSNVLPNNLVNIYKSQDNTLLKSEKFYIYELKNNE